MKRHNVIVLPEAQEEVDAIRRYQTSLDPKRGRRFMDAFNACLLDLRSKPSFQKRKGNYRHLMFERLPFRMVFEVKGDDVIVYQVRHTSRKPSKKFGP